MAPRAKPPLRVIVNPRPVLSAPPAPLKPDKAMMRTAMRDFRTSLHCVALVLAAQPELADESDLITQARILKALVARWDGVGSIHGKSVRTQERRVALLLLRELRRAEVDFPEYLADLYGQRR